LINALVRKGNIQMDGAAEVFAGLIHKNYFVVPIEPRLLSAALQRVIIKNKERGPNRDDLMSDAILGTLMLQFGETSLNYQGLLNIACEWWMDILEDRSLPPNILLECMQPVSYALSMRSDCGVLKGIVEAEQVMRLAGVWIVFITRVLNKRNREFPSAWSAIKRVCERLYAREQAKYNKIIYQEMPRLLIKLLEHNTMLSKDQKIELVINFTNNLPHPDRELMENYIRKMHTSFMN
jgi:hypothetical protein